MTASRDKVIEAYFHDNPEVNPFAILGIPSEPLPSEQEVKSAFRQKAKLLHPDKQQQHQHQHHQHQHNQTEQEKEEIHQCFILLVASKEYVLSRVKAGSESNLNSTEYDPNDIFSFERDAEADRLYEKYRGRHTEGRMNHGIFQTTEARKAMMGDDLDVDELLRQVPERQKKAQNRGNEHIYKVFSPIDPKDPRNKGKGKKKSAGNEPPTFDLKKFNALFDFMKENHEKRLTLSGAHSGKGKGIVPWAGGGGPSSSSPAGVGPVAIGGSGGNVDLMATNIVAMNGLMLVDKTIDELEQQQQQGNGSGSGSPDFRRVYGEEHVMDAPNRPLHEIMTEEELQRRIAEREANMGPMTKSQMARILDEKRAQQEEQDSDFAAMCPRMSFADAQQIFLEQRMESMKDELLASRRVLSQYASVFSPANRYAAARGMLPDSSTCLALPSTSSTTNPNGPKYLTNGAPQQPHHQSQPQHPQQPQQQQHGAGMYLHIPRGRRGLG